MYANTAATLRIIATCRIFFLLGLDEPELLINETKQKHVCTRQKKGESCKNKRVEEPMTKGSHEQGEKRGRGTGREEGEIKGGEEGEERQGRKEKVASSRLPTVVHYLF